MFGVYSKLVNSLPKGRMQSALRATLGPPPEGPGRLHYPCWEGAKITHTMADSRVQDWQRILAPFKSRVRSVLEIGSYEGQSALFWLSFFDASLTCIDPWQTRARGALTAATVERHFDYNLRDFSLRGRCTKIKSKSTPALYKLAEDKARFDLIYIDGDHSREQVLLDSVLAWRLLTRDGIMIWDDYENYLRSADPSLRPTPAINAFVDCVGSHVRILENTGNQLFAIKTAG
jgi:predicted O-methyltransferase YrrM